MFWLYWSVRMLPNSLFPDVLFLTPKQKKSSSQLLHAKAALSPLCYLQIWWACLLCFFTNCRGKTARWRKTAYVLVSLSHFQVCLWLDPEPQAFPTPFQAVLISTSVRTKLIWKQCSAALAPCSLAGGSPSFRSPARLSLFLLITSRTLPPAHCALHGRCFWAS